MFVDDGIPDFRPGRVRSRSNPRWRSIAVAAGGDRGASCACNLSLDFANNFLRLGISSVDHKPARAFWNPAAKENHNETQPGANRERAAPSQPDWQSARIKQYKRRGRAECGANPVRAVNYQIHPAADTRRNQLVDGRIDRRIFSTDARAGQCTKNSIAREVPGKRRQRRADKINGDRYEEQFLPAKAVRSITKE